MIWGVIDCLLNSGVWGISPCSMFHLLGIPFFSVSSVDIYIFYIIFVNFFSDHISIFSQHP